MGKNLAFFAGSSDDDALLKQIVGSGYFVVPPLITVTRPYPPVDAAQHPFSYISGVEEAKLKPYGSPKVRISHAVDPLLPFFRSYLKDNALIAGQIQWVDDNKERARETKPIFAAITKWIKSTWTLRDSDGYFIGPEAKAMEAAGVPLLYVPSGASVTTKGY